MKIQTVAGIRTISGEPPRSTAYYYADIERLKRKNGQNESNGILNSNNRTDQNTEEHPNCPQNDLNDQYNQKYPINNGRNDSNGPNDSVDQNPNELSEYVESNEVINDGAIREVPPLRDRQWSLPEYSTPENRKPDETYSTAGTFPMPEPKEKEPLLAELEVVGRLPLTQLESASGVRRSRSWYLCCPNVGDEEISRDSSWRYSSLRPVTAPPLRGQNGIHMMVATQSSGRPDDAATLRTERDALARALAAERQRAATAARAHDARLAELHGVIAELVRRRAADKQATAIPEEEVSDECESTTQPAGELDNDADRSRTDQNDTSSLLSPAELPSLENQLPDDSSTGCTSTRDVAPRVEQSHAEVSPPAPVGAEGRSSSPGDCESCLRLSERDSQLCLNTARCCQYARQAGAGAGSGAGSCERQRGSPDGARVYTVSPGGCESRQAKLASRVRLRRTEHSDSGNQLNSDDAWCVESGEVAERLALDVCAQADLREALAAAANDGCALSASAGLWRARCARLEADCRVLQCALNRATDTAQRLSCACALQESSCVALCGALRAADRALEAYDVLLALAETQHGPPHEREAAESVARQLLARLEAEQTSASIGEPLLSPGPWLQHDSQCGGDSAWSAECERGLRAHAARLKADTVTLRALRPPPHMFSYHDAEDDEDLSKSVANVSMAEMEAAVMMQEVLTARETRLAARVAKGAGAGAGGDPLHHPAQHIEHSKEHKGSWSRSRRRPRERHWLDARAAETDL